MITLKNGNVLIGENLIKKDILISEDKIVKIGDSINEGKIVDFDTPKKLLKNNLIAQI